MLLTKHYQKVSWLLKKQVKFFFYFHIATKM